MKKRLISLLLAFSMVISLLPVGAFAETPTADPAVQECRGLTFSGGRPNSLNTDGTKGWTYDGTTLTILDGFQLSGDSTLRVTCNVVNQGTIAGGIFTGEVTLPAGHDAVISGGVFGNLNYMEYNTKPGAFRSKITGGVFTNTTAWQIIDSGSKTYTISTKTSFVINTTNQQTTSNKITVVTDASNQCGYAISLGAMEIKNINGQGTQAYCTEHGLTYQVEDATLGEYSLTIPADHVYSEDITLNEEIVLSIVDGYPKQSNGGTEDVPVGDGWSFTASTDAAHPENGVLTLTGSDMDLGSTPVACKVVLRGTSSSSYASIADGTFQNTVTLEKYATLKNGTYNGAVSFKNPTTSITNGTFNAEVKTDYKQFDNETPKISGGAFNQAVDFPQGVYIFGGTFEAPVTTDNGFSCISGGIFKNTVTVSKGYVSGGIFAGTVTLSESGGKYGGLYRQLPTVTLDGGSEAPPLIWTLTASGDDSYTFNDALTLSAGSPLYLAAPYDTSKYEFYITGSDLKYANQIKISVDTAITADGTLCGSIAAAPNRYKFEFAPTQSATVLLQSALDPLEIEATGYPVGTEGGTTAKSGDGWSFTPSTTGTTADGVLALTGSDMDLGSTPVACKVVLNGTSSSNASIASGTFNNTVTLGNYAILKNGTYNGPVFLKKSGAFIYDGTFNNTVTSTFGTISGGTFNKPVTSSYIIFNGIFKDTVTLLGNLSYLSGGIYVGNVVLPTSNNNRHGGLFATLPQGLKDENLYWTLTTSGEDRYTFNDALTLSADNPLYLAALSDSDNYEFHITGSDLKYANQIKISDNTTITADGTPCGSIAAATNRHEFALTRSATVLLQSALDPLVIDETGYPKGTEGGATAKSGEGWSYTPYTAPVPDSAKGWLDLTKDGANNGIFDAINSDHIAQCDVVVNADVTLSSGSFAGTVTSRGVISGGTFKGKVILQRALGTHLHESTISDGTFTETSNVIVDSFSAYIEGGTFHGTVTNGGTIKRGIFYGSVTNTTDRIHGGIQNGTFTGEVVNAENATLKGGTFTGKVTNNGTVVTGTFTGQVLNAAIATLKGGTFTGSVTNNGCIASSDAKFTGPVTNRGTIESGTFEGKVQNYGTLMGGEFSGEVQNDIDPEAPDRSGIICFSTEEGVYAPPLFTETSTVTNTGATIQDGTFLGTVKGVVEGGVYVHKPESTSTISRMTYRYQGSDGNGKTGALTINYKIKDAAYVVNKNATHVFVTLTSRLENINGQTFSGNTCSPNTWALYGKLPEDANPENAKQIIVNKAMSLSLAAGDCTVNLPGDEDHKVVYDGQPHKATIELVSDGLNYLLDKYETVQTEDGGRALKVYYRDLATHELKEEAPTKIGTYQILYKEGTLYFSTNWMFKITENIHSVTVTDGFIVKVEHPGAVDTDDTTGDDTTEDPISTATVQYGDTVTVTIDASKFPSGMVFDRWETTPVDLRLTPADGESYKTVTFTMPAEDVTLRAVPCTVEEKAASGGSSPLGTAALVVVGGAAAGVLVWQGYELGTELYLHSVLPSGVAIPETRGQLAVVLWQAAGSPAPAAPLAPDAADTQKAMAWVVEHALLEDKTGNFDPREPVNKTEVIRAWNKLNNQGLAKQAK